MDKHYFFIYTDGKPTGLYTTSDLDTKTLNMTEVKDFNLGINFFGVKQVDALVKYNKENAPSYVVFSFGEMHRRTIMRIEESSKWQYEDETAG